MKSDRIAAPGGSPHTIAETRTRVTRVLAEHGVSSAQLEAGRMLSHVTGLSRTELLLYPDRVLAGQPVDQLQGLIARRLLGEPLAYVLGVCEFYGIEFQVDRRVLIPRPETELLVERAIDIANRLRAGGMERPVIADIGTGSGCIAIALAMNLPQAQVYAVDISATALEVANANCRRYELSKRVSLLHGDLMEPLPEPAHIVVANLPYVETNQLCHLAKEISFEPRKALDGEEDGLASIRRLLAQMPTKAFPESTALLEIGFGQAPSVAELTHASYPESLILEYKDLSGIERV
ncbi:MAG: peptide chain release factor N(5)-glutamine methyltransferase, partial [Dehalococcoidia bacterium]|nr:peptide chain release factor N(5)-glutamine methyltransferase [Dehalococcoidia bacterium]